MRNFTSGPAASHSRGLTADNCAISRALSFFPDFERMPEGELESVRGDLALVIARLQKAHALSPSLGTVEFSPHMAALIKYAGLA
jgi:hypothetical protein